MPIIFFERGNRRGERLVLPPGGVIRVGRDSGCQIKILDPLASRVHCILRGENHVWTIEDAGSSNGTAVNGDVLAGRTPLAAGDLVRVGDSVFSFLATQEDPWVGKVLGGYRLQTRIGRGGMGTVYRAHQLSLDREVALKILSTKLAKDPQFVARFMQEARAAARLNHPNVVQVHDAGSDSGTYFIAMEYLPGGALEDAILKRGPMLYQEVLPIARDALRALAFAQDHGIVHRDIKPGNLLFAEDGTVKVCDLGIALDLRQPGAQLDGTTAGSPAYMAPEQARGDVLDHRADLYALGATLYHAIAGRPPIDGATVKEILNKKVSQDAPPLRERVPDVPPRLSQVVAKLLALAPADRFASAEEADAALSAALHAHAPVRHTSPASRAGSYRATAASGKIFAAIAVIAILVAAVFVARNWEKSERTAAKDQPKAASVVEAPKASSTPDPLIAAGEKQRAEELARIKAEEKAAQAVKRRTTLIERMLAENDLAGAAAAIKGLPASAEFAAARAALRDALDARIEAELSACTTRITALCEAGRFADARAEAGNVRAKMPSSQKARIEEILSIVSRAQDARTALMKSVDVVTRDVMTRMAALDFPAASKALEDFLAQRPNVANEVASLRAAVDAGAILWQRLAKAFRDAIETKEPIALAFLPAPLGGPIEGRFRVTAIVRDRLSLEEAEGEKRKEMRALFEVTPEALLGLIGDAEVRAPLGLLCLLRAGMEPASALLLAPEMPAEVRTENQRRATAYGALWLYARYEELKAFREAVADAKNAAPEALVFAAREAARLRAAWPHAAPDIAAALKAWFVADRAALLARGPLGSFFHAQSVKTPRPGMVQLVYDFSSEEQIRDFVPVVRTAASGRTERAGGGAGNAASEDERPVRRWLPDKKALELTGEVRFLHEAPFEEIILVTGKVASCFVEAPNVNIAFFTAPKDRLAFTTGEFDGNAWRRRRGEPMRPEYVVLGTGYHIPLALADNSVPAGGGGRTLAPVYAREPSFVIMTGEHGKNLGYCPEQLLWSLGGTGGLAAPFVFQAGVSKGSLQWTVKSRSVPFTKTPEIARLGTTLSTQGSFSLFTLKSTVVYSGIEVQGKLRAEWPAEEARRRAQEEFASVLPGTDVAGVQDSPGAPLERPKDAKAVASPPRKEEPSKSAVPTGLWAFLEQHKARLFSCPAKFSGNEVALDYSSGTVLEKDAITQRLGKSKLVFQRDDARERGAMSFEAGGEMSSLFLEPQFERQVRVSMSVEMEVVAAGNAFVVLHVMTDKAGNGYGCKFGAIAGYVKGVFGFRAGAPSAVPGAMTKPPKDWVMKAPRDWILDLAWPEGQETGSLIATFSGNEVSTIKRLEPPSPGAIPAGRVGISWNNTMFTVRGLRIEGVLNRAWAVQKLKGLGVEVPDEVLVEAGLKKGEDRTSAETGPAPKERREPKEPDASAPAQDEKGTAPKATADKKSGELQQ